MVLPAKYASTPSAIASYNFTDLASGEGFVSYYGLRTQSADILTSNANNYSGTNTTTNNEMIETNSTVAEDSSTKTQRININFDLSFNVPQIIKGTAIVNIPFGYSTSAGSITTLQAGVSAKISHVDSSNNETFLVSGAATIQHSTSSPLDVEEFITIPLAISPARQFTKDEKLRLNINIGAAGTNSQSWVVVVGHDPKNRTGTNLTSEDTNLIAHIPFVIDI